MGVENPILGRPALGVLTPRAEAEIAVVLLLEEELVGVEVESRDESCFAVIPTYLLALLPAVILLLC